MRWDDIATVSAVVAAGSFLGAARGLGREHSSVSRRVAAIEEALGETLFVRGRRLAPTALARAIARHAAEMGDSARRLDTLLAERRARRAAEIGITTNDVLAELLFRALAGVPLRARVRVMVSDAARELEPGAIDVALRPSGAPQPSLRGRRLGVLAIGVFQARRAANPSWIRPTPELRRHATTRWLRAAGDAGPIECDRILPMRDACVAGLGRAVLPAFLAAHDPRLELVEPLGGGIPIWLFVARSRPASPAIAEMIDALASALRRFPGAWAP